MALTKNFKTLYISRNKHIIFIPLENVTHVETQCNHSKLCNFISSWEIVKNTNKLSRKFFPIK